jgi:hypothetical protein
MSIAATAGKMKANRIRMVRLLTPRMAPILYHTVDTVKETGAWEVVSFKIWSSKIALLTEEGSGIAKRIPRGVVPRLPSCSVLHTESA